MGRPVQMEDDAGKIWAKEAQYDAAGRLTEIKLWESDGRYGPTFLTEQRSYNARGQLTRLTIPRYLDEEYIYPAGNAGRIERRKDWVSGEEVVYQYDELNRLIRAETTGPEWGLSFSYDGFGNRTAQTVTKGSGPSWNELVDSATNRLVSNYYNRYDANGNQTRMPWPGYGYATLYYDKLNRLVQVDSPDGKEYYEYTPGGDRVWRRQEAGETTEWYYFYGAYGRLLAVYEQNGEQAFDLRLRRRNIYFAGRMTHEWTWQPYGERLVVVDRLGSRRYGWWGISYYPYGEERGSGEEDDREKFATYWRDGFTGLDYARQRYYSSRSGRFLTPDPYRASAGPWAAGTIGGRMAGVWSDGDESGGAAV